MRALKLQVRLLFTVFLSLLMVFVLKSPQAAWANTVSSSIEQDFSKYFYCVKTQQFDLNNFNEQLKNSVVKKLAKDIQGGSCFQSNSANINQSVDFDRLINVVYTTKTVGNAVVVVVAVGPRAVAINPPPNPPTPNPNPPNPPTPNPNPPTPPNPNPNPNLPNTDKPIVINPPGGGQPIVINPASGDSGSLGIVGYNDEIKIKFITEKIDNQSYSGTKYGVDGINVTQNQNVYLSVEVTDGKGNDIPDAIVSWKDSDGKTGTGKVYSTQQDKVENKTVTFTASSNGQNNFISRSWTVTQPGLKIGPVKVLGEQAQLYIPKIDLGKNPIICFDDSYVKHIPNLPGIKEGDILLGAGEIKNKNFILPPVKILKIQPSKGFKTCANIQIAALEEVFTKTDKKYKFTDAVTNKEVNKISDLNNGQGIKFYPTPNNYGPTPTAQNDLTEAGLDSIKSCNKNQYAYRLQNKAQLDTSSAQSNYNGSFPNPDNIIPQNFYKFNILHEDSQEDSQTNQNNTGGTQETDPTKKYINIDAYFGYDFDPQVSGYFDAGNLSAGVNFGFEVTVNETLIGGVAIDALYEYNNQQNPLTETLFAYEGLEAPRVVFAIGPIPVWIDFPFKLQFTLPADIKFNLKDGVFGGLQTGYLDTGFDSTLSLNGGWGVQPNFSADSLSAFIFCGKVNVYGRIIPSIEPKMDAFLYSLAGPELGLNLYIDSTLHNSKRNIVINPIENPNSQKPPTNPNGGTIVIPQAPVWSAKSPIPLVANVEDSPLVIPITVEGGIILEGQGLSVNELIIPPTQLQIVPGVCLPRSCGTDFNPSDSTFLQYNCTPEHCTNPITVNLDINSWLKKLTGFNPAPIAKTKKLEVNIPISSPVFANLLSGGLMTQAKVFWKIDGVPTSVYWQGDVNPHSFSYPANVVTLKAGTLNPGNHIIDAVLYSPSEKIPLNPNDPNIEPLGSADSMPLAVGN